MRHLAAFIVGCLVCILACTFTQKIKTGEDAFEVKRYALAAQLYQEEFKQAKNRAAQSRIAFMLGHAYKNIHQPDRAAQWFETASELNYGVPALEEWAAARKQIQDYSGAIEVYTRLMEDQGQILTYRRQIIACQQAQQWLEQGAMNPFEIEETGFNTPASEYAPYVYGPEEVLFISDRPEASGDGTYDWTGRQYSDIFIVNTMNNDVRPFDQDILSGENEGPLTLNRDKTEIIFSKCFSDVEYDSYCKLMRSTQRNNSWSEPEVLEFVQPSINYVHPVLAFGDSVLFFASNDPNGFGGYDLYYSRRSEKGWDAPVILNERINTIGNESFPFFHKDTMYFSSDQHPGMGGLDIFRSYILDDGNWAPPMNLLPPVNSGWDDFGFTIDTFFKPDDRTLMRGYFSSARENGEGADDIYAFVKLAKEAVPTEIIAAGDTLEGETTEITAVDSAAIDSASLDYSLYLALRVVEPIFENPDDPNSPRTGKRPLPNASIKIRDPAGDALLQTNNKGLLVIEINYDDIYELNAGYRNHLSVAKTFDATTVRRDPENPVKTVNLVFELDPIFKDVEITLNDIYYDFDEWYIREDAKPALDSLAQILRSNPVIRIQLSSHTDCRGTDAFNMDLSQKRAESAVRYLIESGIDRGRLSAKGYGESRLRILCKCEECTEEEHQENRRTTFKIID